MLMTRTLSVLAAAADVDSVYGLAGDKFIVYGDKGRVAVVEPSTEACKEIAGFQVLGGKDTWAVPVLANGRLYCRSQQDLVCLDVSGK